MPRYFFHTEDGQRLCDQAGTPLPDIEAAKVEAVRHLSRRLETDPGELWETGSWRIIVQDDSGLTLFIIDVSAILAAAFPLGAMPKPGAGPA